MELTQEQLQKVTEYIDAKRFSFLDLKTEILDHIVSDVEERMHKNASFETAFAMVRIRWEKHFRETSSFYFGVLYSESKIVINKASKIFKPYYFLYMLAYFLPFIGVKLIPFQQNQSIANFVNGFLFSTSLVAVLYLLIVFYKVHKTRVKTTYSFIIKTQYFAVLFFVLGLLFGGFLNSTGQINAIALGVSCAGFAATFSCHSFYKKHIEVIETFKML